MSMHTGEVAVSWSGNHSQNAPATLPLLGIDMYEHAYAMDYGAGAAAYVDAVFTNLQWETVDARYRRAVKAHAALST